MPAQASPERRKGEPEARHRNTVSIPSLPRRPADRVLTPDPKPPSGGPLLRARRGGAGDAHMPARCGMLVVGCSGEACLAPWADWHCAGRACTTRPYETSRMAAQTGVCSTPLRMKCAYEMHVAMVP